eukprot:m.342839 g.342839  ORF g.342839 m.342839 type:complete len:323 (+) comp16127_c1_seq1:363-1331(+)
MQGVRQLITMARVPTLHQAGVRAWQFTAQNVSVFPVRFLSTRKTTAGPSRCAVDTLSIYLRHKSVVRKGSVQPLILQQRCSFHHMPLGVVGRGTSRPDTLAVHVIQAKRWFTIKEGMNHYEVLGVNVSATDKEIKQAYHTLSKKWHPDMNATKSSKEQTDAHDAFVMLSEAFNVLSNPAARLEYDSTLFRLNGNEFSNSARVHYVPPEWMHKDINDHMVHKGKSPYAVFSNVTLVFILVGISILALIWQYFRMEKTTSEMSKFLQYKSHEANSHHLDAVVAGLNTTPKDQLDKLRNKLHKGSFNREETQQNPTTTSSSESSS